ncbi:putative HD superfamily hydrolase of NAD metabolism [Atopostipes suicloacalis DSM 15692]|uniref:bis(5'-nucleosyl)-tetraphosphatase (symmetrical) n=1 Tax=Atopostipes suicloacalis DSM 15692 TaxID=1121025 RepID=A0A1M4SZ45_9LACT|nr:bis(5'-nucleosyl)-tetraphosphatase (symmetrical) YqeK [Atopostipes suicloacalis]SHE37465.1 putative HD superfamily hydrolase of NAD metabolism [Atopostipes suicloacalis DSM 15692]
MINSEPVVYSGKYTSYTRNQLIELVKNTMSEKRFEHVLRVEQTAIQLAREYAADVEKASIAALLHDVAKEQPEAEMRDIVISENLNLDLLQFGSQIWHAPVGSILAEREYGITDDEILEAIKYHTIAAPEMSLIAQIIFVADYIEPGRTHQAAEEARKLASYSLRDAVRFEITQTIKYLVENEERIYPNAINAYNAWIERKNR